MNTHRNKSYTPVQNLHKMLGCLTIEDAEQTILWETEYMDGAAALSVTQQTCKLHRSMIGSNFRPSYMFKVSLSFPLPLSTVTFSLTDLRLSDASCSSVRYFRAHTNRWNATF